MNNTCHFQSSLIDVNVLMAAQLMVEMAVSSQEQKLIYQIYQSILFDFRIWSKSDFPVQIGHIQYLSTLVKDDRKYFRRKFGVQFVSRGLNKLFKKKSNSPDLS